ncbi:hypothetical protein DPMN_127294 [Dreissena polymorpha]|uniref:TLDc domain-containing protein n=1 Tax=Dreissena polymorpha TaxID=45954 RepID=A0A9D4H1R7_DREPO|nr:hypothetical protein DPMN_127294 [Dreissena polymorpha]
MDGYSSATFHQKKDNQEPTMTVLYNQHSSMHGEYGSTSWNSRRCYIQDAKNFLCQLKYSGRDKHTTFPIKDAI